MDPDRLWPFALPVAKRLAASGSRRKSIAQHCIQVMTYPVGLVFKRHVRRVAHAVQASFGVGFQSREQRGEVVLRRAGGRDKLESLAQGVIRNETADENLCNLASRDDSIAGIAGLARIALQEDKPDVAR